MILNKRRTSNLVPSEYLPERKYAAAYYDQETQEALSMWCTLNGFTHNLKYNGEPLIKPFGFHTTVTYSNNKASILNGEYDVSPYTARAVGFKVLGQDREVPTLVVESGDLVNFNEYFKVGYGLVGSFPDYIPHVSLSYDPAFPDLSTIPLPEFPLTGHIIKVASIEE